MISKANLNPLFGFRAFVWFLCTLRFFNRSSIYAAVMEILSESLFHLLSLPALSQQVYCHATVLANIFHIFGNSTTRLVIEYIMKMPHISEINALIRHNYAIYIIRKYDDRHLQRNSLQPTHTHIHICTYTYIGILCFLPIW